MKTRLALTSPCELIAVLLLVGVPANADPVTLSTFANWDGATVASAP